MTDKLIDQNQILAWKNIFIWQNICTIFGVDYCPRHCIFSCFSIKLWLKFSINLWKKYKTYVKKLAFFNYEINQHFKINRSVANYGMSPPVYVISILAFLVEKRARSHKTGMIYTTNDNDCYLVIMVSVLVFIAQLLIFLSPYQ